MKVTRTSTLTEIIYVQEIDITPSQLDLHYEKGISLDTINPNLLYSEKCFIISGIPKQEYFINGYDERHLSPEEIREKHKEHLSLPGYPAKSCFTKKT